MHQSLMTEITRQRVVAGEKSIDGRAQIGRTVATPSHTARSAVSSFVLRFLSPRCSDRGIQSAAV